jgi:alpha-tubulin suppressor-like RCC1 family protein
MALKNDGTVVSWGDNWLVWGGRDVGYTVRVKHIVPDDLSNYYVVAIAAGSYHSMALLDDGTVVAWGSDKDEQYKQCDIPADLSNYYVVAIAAGHEHSMALKDDGTVVAWGRNMYGQCNVPANLSNVVSISAGWDNSMALKRDGTVVEWGYNIMNRSNDVPEGLIARVPSN